MYHSILAEYFWDPRLCFVCLVFLTITFTFQLNSSKVFTLSDLLDKLSSQVSTFLPLGTSLHFCRAKGSAFPLLVDFHRMLLTHALGLSAHHFLSMKKCLRVYELGERSREIDFSRREDNLPCHRGRRLELYCFYFSKQTYISIFLLYFSMAKVKSIPGVLYDGPSPPPVQTIWRVLLGRKYLEWYIQL